MAVVVVPREFFLGILWIVLALVVVSRTATDAISLIWKIGRYLVTLPRRRVVTSGN